MTPTDFIAAAAGFCTTIATIPQLRKTWYSRDTEDISLRTFSLLCIGLALWTMYGISHRDWPIILTNGISCTLNAALVVLVLRRRAAQR